MQRAARDAGARPRRDRRRPAGGPRRPRTWRARSSRSRSTPETMTHGGDLEAVVGAPGEVPADRRLPGVGRADRGGGAEARASSRSSSDRSPRARTWRLRCRPSPRFARRAGSPRPSSATSWWSRATISTARATSCCSRTASSTSSARSRRTWATAGEVRFTVPNQPAALAAGTHTLRIRLVRPGDSAPRETNQLALTIVPRITTTLPLAVARDAQGTATIDLNVRPHVRPHQRASLILGRPRRPGRAASDVDERAQLRGRRRAGRHAPRARPRRRLRQPDRRPHRRRRPPSSTGGW